MSYFKSYLYSIVEFIIGLFILNILYYFDILSNNWFKVLEINLIIFSILFNSYVLGNKINKKRLFIGLKFSLIYIIPSLIICIIFNNFRVRVLLYYLIIISISILGSSIKLKRGN